MRVVGEMMIRGKECNYPLNGYCSKLPLPAVRHTSPSESYDQFKRIQGGEYCQFLQWQ